MSLKKQIMKIPHIMVVGVVSLIELYHYYTHPASILKWSFDFATPPPAPPPL